MLKLNTLNKTVKKRKKVGRGNASGHGTYSTRGMNGQGQRKSYNIKRGFEGGQTPFIMRMPKLKGFKSITARFVSVRIDRLELKSQGVEVITREWLKENGFISSTRKLVKIVGSKDYKNTAKYKLGEGVKCTKKLESVFN